MSSRPNNAIWKIESKDGVSPTDRLEQVLKIYEDSDENKKAPLAPIKLEDGNDNIRAYIRERTVLGMFNFIKEVLLTSEKADSKRFLYYPKDVCIFIMTTKNLYVITSGSGYHIIEDFVDYNFPFDVAKRLMANKFTSSESRNLAGSSLSTHEQYRGYQSISQNESRAKIWKNLTGKIDPKLLSSSSFLKSIIDDDKPPSAEMKSSFTIKKSMSLREVISLVDEIDLLPDPTENQKKAMSFMDCLQSEKSKSKKDKLTKRLLDDILSAVKDENIQLDYDICDYKEFGRLYDGTNFHIGKELISNDTNPSVTDVINGLRVIVNGLDDEKSLQIIQKQKLYYQFDDQEIILPSLIKTMNCQIELDGKIYFFVDGQWFFASEDFIQQTLSDFVDIVFDNSEKINSSQSDHNLIDWYEGVVEDDKDGKDGFNRIQSKQPSFYLGHKIFTNGTSRTELFDILRVDSVNKVIYLYHVKQEFDAKFREVCGQIRLAQETLEKISDDDLSSYYKVWFAKDEKKDVDEKTFKKWFSREYNKVFVILCSSKKDFIRQALNNRNKFSSLIARYEVLMLHQALKNKGEKLQLVHIKRKPKND